MIIVEGPDGSGKTRLIERLTEDIGFPVKPRVVSKNAEAMVNLAEWVNRDLAVGLKRAIYDRHRLISEPIYGPLLRAKMEPGFDDFLWLRNKQRLLRSLEPFVIFCLPPIEKVVENVTGDLDNIVVAEHIDQIYWLYYNLAATWPRPMSVWDYSLEPGTYEGDHQYGVLIALIYGWITEKELNGRRW